jgi:hypothetical protein
MDVLVPNGVSSVTLAVSGVKAVSNGKITGVDDVEGTQLCASYNRPKMSDTTNMATGTVNIQLPPPITAITINGSGYVVSGGQFLSLPAANATPLFNQGWFQNGFRPA